MLAHLIGYLEFSISSSDPHHFWPRLVARAELWGHCKVQHESFFLEKSTTYIQVECLGHGFLLKLNYNMFKIWQLSKQSSKIRERILINESKVFFFYGNGVLSFITLDVYKHNFSLWKYSSFFNQQNNHEIANKRNWGVQSFTLMIT
jgi:hypothetical protein